ncbi:hypothetical protein NPIL_61441 [Nephila pilipes]|uniref:Uncharacterized protein n=1 Tax=Nephila pilipes TaxID=299642 RepID=A0A8X6T8I7_NEPPI|nr:hypothetical protein NPIL_61441 [Nephila pilipes]
MPSTIDFRITTGLENTTVEVKYELSSDCNPLIFTINPENLNNHNNRYIKFTNCTKYQAILRKKIKGNPIIQSIEEIEETVEKFTHEIQQAINQSSRFKHIPHAPIPLPQPIRVNIQNRNRLRKNRQETRDPRLKKE